eukprot:TRINITY_DN72117_c0_g1_i1.p1 TRINITY_DN72117_c0_g1~~TRINITY_DN72117_c0_g1_i1.p1  ORF type:complete len:287 (-),score=35.25 TRINITY_DN72117_c0_g1_i1:23-883(-)
MMANPLDMTLEARALVEPASLMRLPGESEADWQQRIRPPLQVEIAARRKLNQLLAQQAATQRAKRAEKDREFVSNWRSKQTEERKRDRIDKEATANKSRVTAGYYRLVTDWESILENHHKTAQRLYEIELAAVYRAGYIQEKKRKEEEDAIARKERQNISPQVARFREIVVEMEPPPPPPRVFAEELNTTLARLESFENDDRTSDRDVATPEPGLPPEQGLDQAGEPDNSALEQDRERYRQRLEEQILAIEQRKGKRLRHRAREEIRRGLQRAQLVPIRPRERSLT